MAAGELLIGSRLQAVIQRIDAAFLAATAASTGSTPRRQPPRLVAVSKTKPIADIVEAYRAGQRYFGENYVQELYDKSHSEELRHDCPDIRWHFVGHCQSKNAKRLAQVLNLDTVETIDSPKLANQLHKEWTKHQQQQNRQDTPRLRVFIQVNTSSEEQKHGCPPDEAPSLAVHVAKSCPAFQLAGLMTIGSLEAANTSGEANKDFERLLDCRQRVAEALGLEEAEGEEGTGRLELSMGMSADFELAIKMGSTNVRIGSTIFGARSYNS